MIIASLYPCPFDVQDRHEFNASVLKGDEIFSYEEGKVTTVKNDGTSKFPERALMLGFKELNITPEQVERWVFPTPKSDISLEDYYLFFSWGFKAFTGPFDDFKQWFDEHVEFVDHQLCHASLAAYGSTFSDCAFLCMDGGGDFGDPRGYVFGDFVDNKFNLKFESTGVDTVANFHSFLTDSIGFSGDDNGKTSGLASYGEVQPDLKRELTNLISITKEDGVKFQRKRFGKTKVNLSKVRAESYDRTKIFGQYPSDTNVLRLGIEYLPHDIAATGEQILQESVLKLVELLRQETDSKNIVFSGGLFQNVALNKALLDSGFENVYFPSAPGDSGLSLGGALYVKNQCEFKVTETLSAYIGPSFSSSEITELLDRHRLIYSTHDNIAQIAAKQLSEGHSVGWFQGKAEFGPRSLGSRSLVADPRDLKSKEKINQLLKKRDWFMPYAPSILEENYEEWVEQSHYSPYMQVAFDMKPSMVSKVPSAVHVDGSSRVHTVRKSENPLYWELINEFNKLTGVPVLLNTSFNRHGIATISTPRQAVEHLLEGCMDYLAIGNNLVAFKDNRLVAERTEVIESEDFLLKLGAVKRVGVFKTHGTDCQMNRYLDRLSSLVGNNIELSGERKIKFLGAELDIDSAQEAMEASIRSEMSI
jgi:carbamoyltransferase